MNLTASSIPMSKTDFKRENLEYKINDMIATGKFEITDLLEELLRISIKDYELGKIEDGKKCLSQAFIIIEAMKEFDNLNYGKKMEKK